MEQERIDELQDEERENNSHFMDWYLDNKDWIKSEYIEHSDDIHVNEDETGLIEYAKEVYKEERKNG